MLRHIMYMSICSEKGKAIPMLNGWFLPNGYYEIGAIASDVDVLLRNLKPFDGLYPHCACNACQAFGLLSPQPWNGKRV